MSEERFTSEDTMHGFQYDRIFGKKEWYIEELDFDKAEQTVSTDLHFPRYYGIKSEEHAKKLCDLLNRQHKEITQLKKENQGLQFKIIDMLDFVKEKGTVTREEIKKWWNGD